MPGKFEVPINNIFNYNDNLFISTNYGIRILNILNNKVVYNSVLNQLNNYIVYDIQFDQNFMFILSEVGLFKFNHNNNNLNQNA